MAKRIIIHELILSAGYIATSLETNYLNQTNSGVSNSEAKYDNNSVERGIIISIDSNRRYPELKGRLSKEDIAKIIQMYDCDNKY
jgi:hypothetical protein